MDTAVKAQPRAKAITKVITKATPKIKKPSSKDRCGWVDLKDPIYVDYHDKEWGIPVYDDRLLFEFLILEGAQAGLSWQTVLKKRENYRKSFDNFNALKISRYDKKKFDSLMANPGIIRNRLKITSTIGNAKAFLEVKKEWGSFSDYIWHFVDGKPMKNHLKSLKDIPAKTDISDRMSKDLKKRGFKFVGSTICYAFMQAVGMVDDHLVTCYKHKRKK
jgi:DNA-3-methyladenine glycosylase I